jgi:tartrate dehydrogenase/decarboxylase/D-malate dehydrogenase
MRRFRIAVVPGDGIGPEVIQAGCRVLSIAAAIDGNFELAFTPFDWGSDHFRRTGRMMPADGLAALRGFDAIYFGAVGDPDIPDHVTLWDLRLAICQGLDQYANVRPTRPLPCVRGPLRPELTESIDWVMVRENSEGEYAGVGGRAHAGLPLELGLDVSIFTRAGIERIARFACELAMSRPRRRLTVVTKSNAQRHGMVLWDEICRAVAAEYSALDVDWKLVDAMTAEMVLRPERIDTVLATNLHADILSDLASALAGSLGVGATANINPERSAPSMFEPIHGSAFDLVGKGIANPIGAVLSACLMLEHLGEGASARRIRSAIDEIAGRGSMLTADLGGSASTEQATAAIIDALQGLRN